MVEGIMSPRMPDEDRRDMIEAIKQDVQATSLSTTGQEAMHRLSPEGGRKIHTGQ